MGKYIGTNSNGEELVKPDLDETALESLKTIQTEFSSARSERFKAFADFEAKGISLRLWEEVTLNGRRADFNDSVRLQRLNAVLGEIKLSEIKTADDMRRFIQSFIDFHITCSDLVQTLARDHLESIRKSERR